MNQDIDAEIYESILARVEHQNNLMPIPDKAYQPWTPELLARIEAIIDMVIIAEKNHKANHNNHTNWYDCRELECQQAAIARVL